LSHETNLAFGEIKMADKAPKQISRRDAMKILAAAAGATALANLPEKWNRPELEVGVLPAHAQTSPLFDLVVGPSDPNANFCFTLISTAAVIPATSGIQLRYEITLSPGLVLSPPAPLTGTIYTNATGDVSLSIGIDISSFDLGDTVIVKWSFEDPDDGNETGIQVFTSAGSGC
jgi:hypothetical protein